MTLGAAQTEEELLNGQSITGQIMAEVMRGVRALEENDAVLGARYLRQALDAGRVEVSVDGDVATVRLQTGGALGSVRLRMRKESDGWYLDQ